MKCWTAPSPVDGGLKFLSVVCPRRRLSTINYFSCAYSAYFWMVVGVFPLREDVHLRNS